MFVRYVNGRAYLAESVQIGGRVVQRHLGPATSALILLTELLAEERYEERKKERQRRDDECRRERRLAEH
jgi:hypothetical protein